jgi:hypothetical protein
MIQFLQTLFTKTSPLGVIKEGPVGETYLRLVKDFLVFL